MKRLLLLTTFSAFLLLITPSCHRSSSEGSSWENVKTAGNYLHKGIDALFGKNTDSYAVNSEDQFNGPDESEFIALNENDLKTAYSASDSAIPQPRFAFGENGVPTLDSFYAPKGDLSSLFQTLYFATDDHVVRNKSDLLAIKHMAGYLKEHSKIYVVVEGHCDERASAAYNMALGTRRSNSVRSLLVKEGVNPNRIYSISYGKEKPAASGHTEDSWQQNRRSQFKIYEK